MVGAQQKRHRDHVGHVPGDRGGERLAERNPREPYELGVVGLAADGIEIGGEIAEATLVRDRVGKLEGEDLAPAARRKPGLFRQFALGAFEGIAIERLAALGDLPRIGPTRKPVLTAPRNAIRLTGSYRAVTLPVDVEPKSL